MDEEKSAIHFIYQQEQGNALWKLRTMQYSAYDVSIIAVILTRFVHKGVSNAMSSSSAVPRAGRAVLHIQHVFFRPVLLHKSLR